LKPLAESDEEALMRSAVFVSCVALALLVVTPQPCAQTRVQVAERITVDVPFDFMVRQVMFPAGSYTVRPLRNGTFKLRAGHGQESTNITTEPIRTTWRPATARLIFAEESGHYQLRELWMNSAMGVKVLEWRAELRTVQGSRVEVQARCPTCK
jgi:hypothetical protein